MVRQVEKVNSLLGQNRFGSLYSFGGSMAYNPKCLHKSYGLQDQTVYMNQELSGLKHSKSLQG
ncbi:hypothetical protein F511_42822 [Dorcoceras hygrometricum]|uniref:Uncharacterized protein n=1 Tax=Dorcoceras hygrometricum TaxID=472368 RepID=A0A2Z7AQ50_9LAMI|nr:hypothetical protein F511_47563 [Dorcoceras hygrometricum]KZV24041.1 hypothetical protein F511_42822 [Dorcoceras hygrometricum]